ncbi:MAG: hypothetical protein F4Y87_04885 [Synechococcus sp. SB0665_bin_28]|nr:hypothetical protein [Synechococcus sp. SB0665_bin_28]MYF19086.1 hypothetical protein [Synechococcus sp. SB0677_bin_5]
MKRGIALAGGAVAEWTLLDQHNRLAPTPVTFMDWRREELRRTARRRMGIHRRTTKALWPVGQDGGRCAIDARQAHCQLPGEGGKEGPGTGE